MLQGHTDLSGAAAGGLKQALAALGRDVYVLVVCAATGERYIVRYGQVLNRALHAVTQEYAWLVLPTGAAPLHSFLLAPDSLHGPPWWVQVEESMCHSLVCMQASSATSQTMGFQCAIS
jgi:hypothetical protein